MSVKEIIKSEERNKNNLYDIYFYLEGSFWRAYEWSAYLSRHFPSELKDNERLNPTKKVVKDYEEGYVQVGLQLPSFDKYFPKVTDNDSVFEINSKRIIIHAESFFKDEDFSDYKTILNEWKSTIKLTNKEKNKYKDINIESKNTTTDSLMKEIITYPIENKSMIECIEFLSYIRNKAIKIIK